MEYGEGWTDRSGNGCGTVSTQLDAECFDGRWRGDVNGDVVDIEFAAGTMTTRSITTRGRISSFRTGNAAVLKTASLSSRGTDLLARIHNALHWAIRKVCHDSRSNVG